MYHANKESKQKNRGRTPWTILENSHEEHEHGAIGQPSTAHKEIPASNIKKIFLGIQWQPLRIALYSMIVLVVFFFISFAP